MQFTKEYVRVFDAFCLVAKESENRSDISLAKIAKKLGMSRQNLIKTYFRNVDEIIRSLHLYVDQDVKEALLSLTDISPEKWVDYFAHEILPLLHNKRDYLAVLYGDIADPTWFEFLEETYFTMLIPYFNSGDDDDSKVPLDFSLRFAIRQILSILSVWLTSPEPEDPFTFSKKFIYFMTHSTRDMLSDVEAHQTTTQET